MKKTTLSVRNRNLQFRKVNAARKRVMIAKDVIEQINAEKYQLRALTYVCIPELDNHAEVNQEVAEKVSCQVCGLGGAFMSALKLGNNFSVNLSGGRELNSGSVFGFLGRFFDDKQMLMIERFFEGWADDGWDFRKKHPDQRERAIAIFENIIKNKGEFKPSN